MPRFQDSTYLSQVRMLRKLAEAAVARYPIQVRSLRFIQHAENATFKAVSKQGEAYLVRIHRDGYHTDAAINEELQWLAQLSKVRDLRVPTPVRGRNGKVLQIVATPEIPEGRRVCVFKWIDGREIPRRLTLERVRDVGRLLARLQAERPKTPSRHRRYWTADQLAGPVSKFGPVTAIPFATKRQQQTIDRGRKRLHRALKTYETRFPKRLSLIHADLHFGNLLIERGQLAPIDFDDCGVGFHVYDLAVSFLNVQAYLGKERKDEIPAYRAALIDGYSSLALWTDHEDALLDILMLTRRLVQIGWLASRANQPRYHKPLKSHLKFVLKAMRARG